MAAQHQEEIVARFDRERFRFANAETGDVIIADGFCNGEVNKSVVLKGVAGLDELRSGQVYRFFGRWTSYFNKRLGASEKQFTFVSFVRQAPAGKDSVIAYLVEAGEGYKFGRVRAARCWEVYGPEAVAILRDDPARVVAMLNESKLSWDIENAQRVANLLSGWKNTEAAKLDLTDLLNGRGFPKSLATKIIQEWGNRGAEIIRRDPYKLMRFKGCGFRRTDAMWLDLGLPAARLKRQTMCAWHAIASDTDGHTWHPAERAENAIRSMVSGAGVNTEKALRLACRGKVLAEMYSLGNGPISSQGSGFRWLAEASKAKHERQIADAVIAASDETPAWPDFSLLDGCTEHQQENLTKACQGVVGILGGSPGTGKTYTIAQLIKLLSQEIGLSQILVGAPTGKAAVRVTENLQAAGINLKARTWHSLLMQLETSKQPYFKQRILIGDESSMLDTDLFARIIKARAKGTHFLLVGDTNQLPPVGHGAPMRDLIAAGLPYGELREIKRNSGGIVEACAAIRDGRKWEASDNLIVLPCYGADEQIKSMIGILRRAAADGRNPVWDCQVVVPVNEKSQLARKALNKILQEELNKNPGTPGTPFRVGDKIVNTKNGYFPAVDFDSSDDETATNDRGEVYVANGELAEVVEVNGPLVVAKLANPARVVKVFRVAGDSSQEGESGSSSGNESGGCTWELGYALSVHRSQGSEWPVVIVMVDEYPGAKMICSREWHYTAISRAKERCCLVGKKSTVDSQCRRVAINQRKTFLRELVLSGLADRLLAGA